MALELSELRETITVDRDTGEVLAIIKQPKKEDIGEKVESDENAEWCKLKGLECLMPLGELHIEEVFDNVEILRVSCYHISIPEEQYILFVQEEHTADTCMKYMTLPELFCLQLAEKYTVPTLLGISHFRLEMRKGRISDMSRARNQHYEIQFPADLDLAKKTLLLSGILMFLISRSRVLDDSDRMESDSLPNM